MLCFSQGRQCNVDNGFWRIGIQTRSGLPSTLRDKLPVLQQGISDMAAPLDVVFANEPES